MQSVPQAPAPRYEIAEVGFSRKADIEQYVREIKHHYKIGRRLLAADQAFMIDLFTRYDQALDKHYPGNPIVDVYIRANIDNPGTGFKVVYANGFVNNPSVSNAIRSLGGRDVSWERFA